MNDWQIVLDKAKTGERITEVEALTLFKADLLELGEVADLTKKRLHKNWQKVSFVIDRNVNYTNACTAACRFCAFAFWPGDERTYLLDYQTIYEKTVELIEAGGTQLLLQGGHNPELDIIYYENLFQQLKKDFPQLTLHSLSPSEIEHIAQVSSLSLTDTILRLKEAGWDSLPGGGAEILVDRVRNLISPLKITSENWLKIMRLAHENGIGASATMMFGHVETYADRIEHLSKLRALQDKTGGFRAFICWTYQNENNPLSKDLRLEQGEGKGDGVDYLKTQAISRIFLDNIPNIQASWVTQGFAIGQTALHFGANDFGGTMLEENVVSAAGNAHSKSNQEELIHQIRQAGFIPVQRDTFYREVLAHTTTGY